MPKMAVTPVLIGLNVAIFGLMLAWGLDPMQPAIDSLIQWGANYGPKTTQGEWWRMFTCMFLHIGVLHLLFNMIALWNVGGFMERLLGSTGFLVLYLLAGLLGSVASAKYVTPLLEVFGERLFFPGTFVGRGDMSRGGLMLRCARAGTPLDCVPVRGAVLHGTRPPKLGPLPSRSSS